MKLQDAKVKAASMVLDARNRFRDAEEKLREAQTKVREARAELTMAVDMENLFKEVKEIPGPPEG